MNKETIAKVAKSVVDMYLLSTAPFIPQIRQKPYEEETL